MENQTMQKIEKLCFGEKSPQIHQIRLLHTPRENEDADQNAWAQECVSILNQKLEERINWEHQIFLLTGQEGADSFKSLYIQREAEEFDQQLNNILKADLQYIGKLVSDPKKQSEAEIKTPEIFSINPPQRYPEEQLQSMKIEISQPISKGCSCKKSQCLKMYCQCFKNGKTCQDCACCDCKNTEQNEEVRQKAMDELIEKSPEKFQEIMQYRACKCTKSECSKNYCQCFANGLKCGKYCKCKNCQNGKKQRKLKRDSNQQKGKKKQKKRYTVQI